MPPYSSHSTILDIPPPPSTSQRSVTIKLALWLLAVVITSFSVHAFDKLATLALHLLWDGAKFVLSLVATFVFVETSLWATSEVTSPLAARRRGEKKRRIAAATSPAVFSPEQQSNMNAPIATKLSAPPSAAPVHKPSLTSMAQGSIATRSHPYHSLRKPPSLARTEPSATTSFAQAVAYLRSFDVATHTPAVQGNKRLSRVSKQPRKYKLDVMTRTTTSGGSISCIRVTKLNISHLCW